MNDPRRERIMPSRSPAPSFAAARPLAGRVATAAVVAALALAISPWGIAYHNAETPGEQPR
jgi:hypothetical protein